MCEKGEIIMNLELIPMWLCIPFAGLLLCIAVLPLFFGDWWEKYKPFVVIFWIIMTIIPFAVLRGVSNTTETVLACVMNDYIPFIILLFGLFCVSGDITLDGDLAGSPRINVALLLIGTFLSGWIGTTGASMLLVRPVIKANAWRKRKKQIFIFFIFLISNIGGCLTPVGDPPLLMGFMRGVPFFWSLRLLPIMALNLLILLVAFYFVDRHEYRKDIAEGMKPDISKPGVHIGIRGLHNVAFLFMIVMAVVMSGVLPKCSLFHDANQVVYGIKLFGNVSITYPTLIEITLILLAAGLSFKTTQKEIRTANHFTWSAIWEVAVLFIGIFITMQPALMLLKAKGGSLGLDLPAQMFWASGALSSFLDNTPTYLVFLTTAGALNFSSGVVTAVGAIPVEMLMAISCGAVFMGANTYIGNAPNFMVKSIADENGIRMPSFFGYMGWSLTFLIPVFLLDMVIFFL